MKYSYVYCIYTHFCLQLLLRIVVVVVVLQVMLSLISFSIYLWLYNYNDVCVFIVVHHAGVTVANSAVIVLLVSVITLIN